MTILFTVATCFFALHLDLRPQWPYLRWYQRVVYLLVLAICVLVLVLNYFRVYLPNPLAPLLTWIRDVFLTEGM